MGVVAMVTALAGSVIGAVLLGLLKDEASAWMPRLNKIIMMAAIKRLPEEKRERYTEEWEADILEYPGKISQLVRVISFYKASYDFEVFSWRDFREKARWFITIGCVSQGISVITYNFLGYGYWTDHLIKFANFSITVAFVWTAVWMIRLRPHIGQIERDRISKK